ncbi:unnamed protein product [Heligmosomoides polygyrus]|uniref:HTH_48 domain-containing protein n=1 Tax=Heligmosomoides polygyrus TaxID=6339 RepID=A0A183FSU7_HELPZ|nr:unnamed protein product [Heligmosomoides polygyrus]
MDRDRIIVTDAKIVPYETVAPQRRPLICTPKIVPPRLKQIKRRGAARIKCLVQVAFADWCALRQEDTRAPEVKDLQSRTVDLRLQEAETRLSVMETKMLRWTAGLTRMDHIRNDVIRQKFGVTPIADKMCEARLRWYGTFCVGKEAAIAR